MAIRRVVYSPVHNLRYLLELLEDSDCDIEDLWDLIKLNPFAVQYRYEAYEEVDAGLDRRTLYEQVHSLIEHVEALLIEHES